MNEKTTSYVHWSFWVIASVALVWNVMGAINFIVQMNPDMVAAYRESEQAIIVDRPMWATIAFAIAVFGGAIGCLLLLLRKSAAIYLFIASLVGVVVAIVHSLTVDNVLSVAEIVGTVVMPVAVATLLIWYSKLAERKGWVA